MIPGTIPVIIKYLIGIPRITFNPKHEASLRAKGKSRYFQRVENRTVFLEPSKGCFVAYGKIDSKGTFYEKIEKCFNAVILTDRQHSQGLSVPAAIRTDNISGNAYGGFVSNKHSNDIAWVIAEKQTQNIRKTKRVLNGTDTVYKCDSEIQFLSPLTWLGDFIFKNY